MKVVVLLMQIILTKLFRLLLAVIASFNLLLLENDGDVVVLYSCWRYSGT